VKFLSLFTLATALALGESPATESKSSAPPEEPAVKFSFTHLEELHPQVVRICYLEEGTREIVLPPIALTVVTGSTQLVSPADADQPQVIRIVNTEDGTREIAVTDKP
jgi:hypothetical protein